ncbi:type II toxin-antitoxin system VapC family toxin [Rhizobium sp. P32RR-XVIII]|uniref:type II toxin-antitoxin system VapC family toxin n=1 Tax=Rhizobium sp. P32RR-XVIII TaxID=2726738 RepID=UPI0014572387|nr:type II toxin-antitoxin system VapC family toxin [Rhizobium sp. P32RR-XVIII]NLS04628.1 type II toxin-antitoxin system VapC family toxin [Rhizobium sp. P32RR-XVIII]
MNAVLLDTHAWAWSLTADSRLTARAVTVIQQADAVLVSPISLFEIGQKVRLGKWPEMQPYIHGLAELLERQGGRTVALTPDVCLKASTMDWAHRDPFDRLIAATAMANGLPLISADTVFDGLSTDQRWIARLW